MLKSSGKVTSRNKEVHDPYRLEGNEYFDNIKRKQVVGKGKKGKSREKKMDKSKEKSAGQVKKNIDKYYFWLFPILKTMKKNFCSNKVDPWYNWKLAF